MEFDQGYIEKVYLFARKRTNSIPDAQDLAQEILTEVIHSLRTGAKPKNFAAWFWTIARRCYARFANKERLYRLSGQVLPECQDYSEFDRLHEQLANDNDLRVVYRELSLLAKIYREIIIKHYVEGKSVNQIATELEIPAGTIKRRLHDARLIIQRGVRRMNRITGKRSCIPDTLTLWASGEPGKVWPYLRRQLPQNILSIAAQRLVTIDELCAEIGLARPYMEEEVELLEEITLLKRATKSAYSSDVIILDRLVVSDIEAEVASIATELAGVAYNALDKVKEKLLETGFYGNTLNWKFLRWIFILQVADSIMRAARNLAQRKLKNSNIPDYAKPWYFCGIREQGQEPKDSIPFYGCNGDFIKLPEQDLVAHTESYSIQDFLPCRTNEFDAHAIDIMLKIAMGSINVTQLAESQKDILAELIAKGVVIKDENEFTLKIPVFGAGHSSRIISIIESAICPLTKVVADLWLEMYSKIEDLIDKQLHNQINNYLSGIFSNGLRHYFVEFGRNADLLSQPSVELIPLEAFWITYGDSFVENKFFPSLDNCTKLLQQSSIPANNVSELNDRIKAAIGQVLLNETEIMESKHKEGLRLGGKMYSLKNAQSIRNRAGSIDAWIAEFSDLDQALSGIEIKSHRYTGRSIYQDPRMLIWVVWCMVPEGVNSCFALFNVDRFLISINVDTGITSEVFANNDWDSIISHPGVKQQLKVSVEMLEKFLKVFDTY